MRNVEWKARVSAAQHRRLAARLRALGARDVGVFEQVDTFFTARGIRVKLRVEAEGAWLVLYRRPDRTGSRRSRYRRIAVDDAAAALRALAGRRGVRAVVRKRRHLFLESDVRVHLDTVEGLGTFVEVEVPVGPGRDEAAATALAEQRRRAFGIPAAACIGRAYVDLLLEAADASG